MSGRLEQSSGGLLAENGHAPEEPALIGGEIRARVQRTPVVPHYDVAGAPDVPVDELRLLLVVEQELRSLT